jgi:hypothetical protein
VAAAARRVALIEPLLLFTCSSGIPAVPVDGTHMALRKSHKKGKGRGSVFMNATLAGSEGSQAVDFCDTRVQKLVPRYDQCLSSSGGYVEK